MKGLKKITLEGAESAIFHFETCELWCDFVAHWGEKKWTEIRTDPYCFESFKTKELISVDIISFDIAGSSIKFYKEKHREFENLLYQKLID